MPSEEKNSSQVEDAWRLTLGRGVRQRRKACRLTLKALAERSGLSTRFLSQVEAGQANPSLGSLRELAEALQLSVVELLHGPEGQAKRSLRALVDKLAPAEAERALIALREFRLRQRKRSVALLGLRGAGKSTVGVHLAEQTGRALWRWTGRWSRRRECGWQISSRSTEKVTTETWSARS